MAQHFLLSAKSKTISELQVARMSEDEARVTFEKLRWSETDGEPICSTCGCTESYIINTTSKTGKEDTNVKLVELNIQLQVVLYLAIIN